VRGSIERVRAVIRGQLPDRAPLYDLLRNDAVISHFAGETLTLENAPTVVYRAYEPALDATRPVVRMPDPEDTVTLEDGRKQRRYRWTAWTAPVVYASSEDYAAAKRAYLDAYDPSWMQAKEQALREGLAWIAEQRALLGEVFFFPGAPGGLLQSLYGEVGLEAFIYFLTDYPEIIEGLMDVQLHEALAWVEHLPADHGIEAVFVGDDIAYNGGPMLRPAWFAVHYLPRLRRVMAAYHHRGIAVLFHSDGNLNPIMDGLVEAGIDGLNPIEVLAGMDAGDLHRRYPHLFLAGGIDVSQLLPLGSPQEVTDAVKQALEATGGRLMMGSSTELNNQVPLANYMALREAVFACAYR
jgi:uroporphyrinogen decarboxylase